MHKNAPNAVCKFQLVHLLAPKAIFVDFFSGGAKEGPENIHGTKT